MLCAVIAICVFGYVLMALGRLKGHAIDFGFLEPLEAKSGEEQNVHILQFHCQSEPAALTEADRTILPLSGQNGDLVVVWLDASVSDPLCRNFEKQLMQACS